jgi:leader peptidase (prepilin peptidase)/N-methyltransferase
MASDPISLLLWAGLGLLGGAVAGQLADRLLARMGRGQPSPSPADAGGQPGQTWPRALAFLGRPAARERAAVALLAAVLIALLRLRIGDDLATAVPALATLVLITATLTDLRARLIPNALTYPATALALLASPLPGGVGPLPALFGALAAGGLSLLIFFGGALLYRRGDVFGLGDVKLALVIGAVAGIARALTAMMAGMMVGGLLAALIVLRGRSSRATMPYGPALAIGAYVTLLLF